MLGSEDLQNGEPFLEVISVDLFYPSLTIIQVQILFLNTLQRDVWKDNIYDYMAIPFTNISARGRRSKQQ